MNVAISRKRPGLLYALAVTLPFTAQAEETVVVTATPAGVRQRADGGYSAQHLARGRPKNRPAR